MYDDCAERGAGFVDEGSDVDNWEDERVFQDGCREADEGISFRMMSRQKS